ncbi:2'-5' RNA ligase family protein [Luteimonas sp. MHLX1A]|uniref:2'-5' RNA ligase family protein n=1 Tax=Alterluteimonas muca TaxID=2878684 RepID=UPI001E2ABFC2|nr:2'-5' RNA ligase family protein [Luteimonas sp. MHLX1A]MCD9045813.1 2'-5' RNA ligase family protein [Luteimonas sp. MHLX1A]
MSDFIAWLPDADTLDALEALCAALPGAFPAMPPLQLRRRAQLHMTLRYLAEGLPDDPAPLYAALADLAARTPRLPVQLGRLESWPGADVLVARPAPSDALDELFAALDAVAVACGHAPEPRRPRPHITLAYLPRGQSAAGLATPAPGVLPLPIDACLGSLSLARTAPGRYDSLQWWPLAEPPCMSSDAHPR